MAKSAFSSIALKLGAVFALFACVLLGSAYINISLFQQVSRDMAYFNQVRVPELMARSDVANRSSQLRDIFTSILLAEDPAVVEELLIAADAPLAAIDDIISQDGGSSTDTEAVRTNIRLLSEARGAEFLARDRLSQSLSQMKNRVTEINEQLVTISDEAIFDLTIKSEETVDLVGNTLNQLVERDFASLKTALLARAYMNYYAGVAMAVTSTTSASYRTLLTELAVSADAGLENLSVQFTEFEALKGTIDPIAEFRNVASEALSGGRPPLSEIIAKRSAAEKAIVSAIDEIEFSLFITASDAQSSNENAIKELVDVQIGKIIAAGELSVAVRTTVITALQAGAARTIEEIEAGTVILDSMIADLAKLKSSTSPATASTIDQLLEAVNSEKGIPALRTQELVARANASEMAGAAAGALFVIVSGASDAMTASLGSISNTSEALAQKMAKAESNSYSIMGGATAILLLSFFGAIVSIVRPLKRVAKETERLSEGNLDPIEGMDRYGGEVGQMVGALKVFRNRMLDRIRLEEEQKAAEIEKEQTRRDAEEAKRAAKAREYAAERQREEERRAIKEEEDRKRAELERKADLERQARADELKDVIAALADGLGKLSEGNLQARIEVDFPTAYQRLSKDYNLAVDRLSRLLLNISDAGRNIREESKDISASAFDLSKRTEVSASTLEETARSLRELTKSVQSTASGADAANEIGRRTVKTAEQGAAVVRDCVASMTSIELSSKEISKVVAVIEDIAFQTNLLALNAGVEAARAGESGRGFAVVASEVRALAQRSSDAAQKINTLITESGKVVEAGVEATGKAGSSLDDIESAVGEMATKISEIAAAALEQSRSIDEISHSAGELDKATQQNAALFEETTAANQRLSSEAASLDAQLKAFDLPAEGSTTDTLKDAV